MKKLVLIPLLCALSVIGLSPRSSAQQNNGSAAPLGQPQASTGIASSSSQSRDSKAPARQTGTIKQPQNSQQAADKLTGFRSPNGQENLPTRVPSATSPDSKTTAMQTRENTLLPSAKYKLSVDVSETVYSLPALDLSNFKQKPNQIGINRTIDVSMKGAGKLYRNADGSEILILAIKSPGAVGIRVHLEDFNLPEGDEVYIYGPTSDSQVQGPYSGKGPWEDNEFWSGTVDGETAIIEYYAKNGASDFHFSEISHIYGDSNSMFAPNVLSCEIDAACYTNTEKNAVGRIVFQDNGSFVCSGTLLNDRNSTFTPYFLTANHCVSTQTVAQTVETYWFYQTTSCNSGALRSGIFHSVSGSNLLATSQSADSTLIRILGSLPGGLAFSGWDSGAKANGTAVFGFHHPGGGTPPSTTSFLRRADGSTVSTASSCSASGLTNGYQINWSSGITEPGSSGSGLWYTNQGSSYLIGVDSCGPVNVDCNYNGNSYALYGKFSNFYPLIQSYINPSVTPPSAPTANAATGVTSSSFTANWSSSSGATGYRLDVSTNSSFSSYVSGYQDLDVGNVLSRSVTGLSANTTYYYRVRAYNAGGTSGNSNTISLTTTSTGSGLVISATFDSSITGNANSAAIQAMINQAIAIYQATFRDTATVSILFRYSTTGPDGTPLGSGTLAQSTTVIYSNPWNTYINALRADAKTANDSTANASLPASALTTNMIFSSANGRVVGLNTPPAMFANGSVSSGGPYDGIVTLNSAASFQFTRPPTSNNYDALRTTEHEIDEVLGLGSYVNRFNDLRPQDLFSWSAPGTRNLSSSGSRYFSINSGSTNIVGFNQNSNGDFGDWLSGTCPQTTPYAQNAFSCPGQVSDVTATSPEGINLDVIGYDLFSQAATLRIDNVAPKAGRASGGQTITLSGAFAGLSTVTIGGINVSWSYTSGTSAIAFTSPAHAVGAVDIILTPTSGSALTKSNAFAYLPTVFTDDTLVAGVTTARAQHIIELRQAVDALRAVAGLSAATWTDAGLPAGTSIKAVHITELRARLEEAAAQLGFSAASYTDPTLGVGLQIKRIHIEELRQRLRAIAG
jgi:hypothetical protein